jgi:peptidoglycan/LPS O-acetylase OafA/YrhL
MDAESPDIPQPSSDHHVPLIRMQRDPALDGLRGLAILLVFIFHYGGGLHSGEPFIRLIGYTTEAGWIGVVLFFALSGFLITGSLWEAITQRHLLRNFYARRALRILPIYFAALIAAFVFSVARGATFAELKPLGIFFVFLQDMPYLQVHALQAPSLLPLYHLWTLAVEEQFYLIWPLVLLLAHSRRHAVRLSLWFAGLTELFLLSIYTLPAFNAARHNHLFDVFLFTHTCALALGAAVSLALGSRANTTGRKPGSSRVIRRWAKPAFFIGLAIFLYSSYHGGSFYLTANFQFWLGLPGISIAAAATIPLVLRRGLPRTLFSFPPLGWLGRISYGFYIFHILLEPLYSHLGTVISHETSGDEYQFTRLLVAFFLTCLISWLSFHLFEMPFLSLKRFFPMEKPLPWGEPLLETHSARRRKHRSTT